MRRFGATVLFLLTILGPGLFADETPEYILESPDVIEVELKSETLAIEDRHLIDGTHLIAPDGFINLGRYGRVMVRELTLDECAKALHFHLSKPFDSKAFEVDVRLSAGNSKEYYVSFFSPKYGQQRLVFSHTGSETLVEAVRNLNDENAATLAPGTSPKLIVLRSGKIGKPVQMLEVDFNEVVAEPEKDIPLRSGDTLLMTTQFDVNDLQPDLAVDGTGFSSLEDMLALTPQPETAEAEEKIAGQYSEPEFEPKSIRGNHRRRCVITPRRGVRMIR